MTLYEKLNRLDDSLVESKRVVKKKKLIEGISNSYEIDGKEVTWPEYFEHNMETNDYFMDEQLFSAFYDKAVELVEKEGFTDVFTEPSTQAGRGGDFFWATKDGISYRGSYDYEEEQQIFYDAAVNADSEEEAIANLAKAYAKLIISNLTVDEEDYDDDIDEMLTEENNAREKLMNTYPDDFGHWEPNRNPVKTKKVPHKTLDQYARDPETEVVKFDNNSTNSFKELGARQKLRNAFPELNIPYADSDEHENRPLKEAIKDTDYVIVLTHPNMPQDKRYSYFGSNYRMTRDLNKAMTYPGEFSAKDEIKYALDATDGHWDPSYADRFSVMTIAQVKELLSTPKPEKVSRAVHHNPSAQEAAKPIAKEIHEVIKKHNVSLSSFLKLITELVKSEDPNA